MIPQGAVDAVNMDPVMRRWGRLLDADVLLQVGERICRFSVRDGAVVTVTPGPLVMPNWTLAFRVQPEAWTAFMQPEPPPGLHDVMALVKRRVLAIEGDLRPFMQHVFWFKGLFAAMRQHGAEQPA